jgi:hypothetical protein
MYINIVMCRLCDSTRINCVGFRIGTDSLLDSLFVHTLVQLFTYTVSTLWNSSAKSEHNLLLSRWSQIQNCEYETRSLYRDLQRVISLGNFLILVMWWYLWSSWYWTLRVKVKVALRLTISHSVSLGVEPNLGIMTRYLLLFESHGLFVGCPLWREDWSVFYICCWPCKRSLSRVRVLWD